MSEPKYIPIAKPCFGEEEIEALREVAESGWLTQGPKVSAFEEAFARRHQVEHGMAVSSCTAGLHLALAVLGVGPGDEVIVPAFTWISTANAVLYCGATPVFVDVEPVTFNLDVDRITQTLTSRTKAVIPVHLFGFCVDMDGLRSNLGDDIFLVEDAACAAGAEYNGRPAGGLGHLAVFSFHPRKIITTGEGGMVTTDDPVLAEKVRVLRNHGASEAEVGKTPQPHLMPDFDVLGYNYRMTDLQGAVGRVQLERLDAMLAERRRWAAYYREKLAGFDWLRTPEEPAKGRHGWQSFVVNVDPAKAPAPRNEIMESLQARGVATRPGTHAVPMLAYYRDRFGLSPEDFPVAKACAENTMALPLHNQMTADDYDCVVEAIREL